MALQISAMIVGLLLTVAASLWGLNGLRQDYGLALQGYKELRQVFEAGSQLAIARSLLASEHPDRAAARAQVELAATRYRLVEPVHGREGDAIGAALADAVKQLRRPPEEQTDQDVLAVDAGAVDRAMGEIAAKAAQVRRSIEENQRAAGAKRRATVMVTAVVSATAVVGAVILGAWQYRGVMLPLNRLRSGVRKVAVGQFSQRITPAGGEEFASLATDFNRMAEELDGFYHQLEEKVEQKSRELVRSERLASVGYLAAGVAHEINNPLGIISGYAEYTLEQLKSASNVEPGRAVDPELLRSLQVISDEAFRCKDITAKLLSLARQGNESRRPVNLADLAEQVAAMVSGLPMHRGRTIDVHADGARDELVVDALEGEMKQVLLNLTLNALESIPAAVAIAPAAAKAGRVTIEVVRRGERVELSVIDNGKGMSPRTLERIFEPFFTEKRGVRQAGTGLGLSISHAIVQSHGGQIRAASEGVGRGSRFTVDLPALAMAEKSA